MNNDSIHETMDNLSQLLGYSTPDKTPEEADKDVNPYKRAADLLKEYVLEDGIDSLTSKDDIKAAFLCKFCWDI